MTKYYGEQKRIDKIRQQKADLPIVISGEHTKEDKKRYYCNYCQYNLVKISDNEWYCNHCKTSAYPQHEQLRSKSKITTPIGMNLEPCLSYAPDPNAQDNNPEIQGTFKALADKGIKITQYEERDGANRPLKRNRWS
jgi:ribosomal protein L37AE/L43A